MKRGIDTPKNCWACPVNFDCEAKPISQCKNYKPPRIVWADWLEETDDDENFDPWSDWIGPEDFGDN